MTNVLVRPDASRRVLGDFLGFDPFRAAATSGAGFDITKTDNGYSVEMPVPGYGPDHIDITLEDRVLTISGKSDRRTFTRALLVPEEIDADTIGARVEFGLLTLTLNTHPKAQPRKIAVNFSGN